MKIKHLGLSNSIINRIQSQNLTDVGILVPYNKQVKEVYNYLNSKGLKAQVRYKIDSNNESLDTLDFSSTNPSILTYHSSKGLQFENVFLPFCEVDDEFMRNPLYVGITRASKSLVITHAASLSPFFNAVPSNLYQSI